MKNNHLTDRKFDDFELDESLKSGLNEAGFEYCTPIQAATLPIALEGKDVAGQAQTGTGKTIAFLLACSDYLLRQQVDPERENRDVLALILAPTRELAIQIHQDAEVLLKHTGLRIGLVYGGTRYDSQKSQLESGVDLLIGTPGRLIDLFNQKLFALRRAQVLVIDEADRMFDMGFIRDIRFLIRRMPPAEHRLNLLYSATLSYRVMELAYEHMNNPDEIKMDDQIQVASGIKEQCYCPATEEKSLLLMNMLRRFEPTRALVFANTRITVDKISRLLTRNRITHGMLAGHASQSSREKELRRFKQGKTKVLVATDVAARGLHIPEVSHVFNYDLPEDPESYVHRVGRTARAGFEGMAISFLCDKYAFAIEGIESLVGHDLPKHEIEPWMLEAIKTSPDQDCADSESPESTQPDLDSIKQTSGIPADITQPVDATDPDRHLEQAEAPTDKAAAGEGQASDDPKARPKPRPPLEFETFRGPKNRFSKRFGEIPMIG